MPEWTVGADRDLPLEMERPWDAERAVRSVRRWASSDGSGSKDTIDFGKYKKAFLIYDAQAPDNLGAYKLPFAEFVDGRLRAIWRGLVAARAALLGARGGVDAPPDVRKRAHDVVASYFEKAGRPRPEFREGEELRQFVKVGLLREEAGEQEKGRRWLITVIEAGVSHNRHYYSPEFLREHAPMFEGVKVYAYRFGNLFKHLDDSTIASVPEGFARNLVGWLENARFEEDGGGRIVAELVVTDPWWRSVFLAMKEEGRFDVLGFSINALGTKNAGVVGGQHVLVAESFQQVRSVDVVTVPGAGGRLRRLVAGLEHDGGKKVRLKKEQLMEMILKLAPHFEAAKLQKLSFKTLKETLAAAVQSKIGSLLKTVKEDMHLVAPETEEQEAEWKEKAAEVIKLLNPDLADADIATLPITVVASMLLDELKKTEEEVEKVAAAGGGEAPAETPAGGAGDVLDKAAEMIKQGKTDEALAMLQAHRARGDFSAATEAFKAEAAKILEQLERKAAEIKASVDQERKLQESKAAVEAAIREEGVPAKLADKARAHFDGKVCTKTEVARWLEGEKKFLESFLGSDPFKGVKLGAEPVDKVSLALAKLLGYKPTDAEKRFDVPAFGSIREAYQTITGDAKVEGKVFKEQGISSDFPALLRDAINKRAAQLYAELPSGWRQFVRTTSVTDFKDMHIVRLGGIQPLSVISEVTQRDSGFPTLPLQSEDEITYRAERRAGIYRLLDRAIINDDTRQFQRVPEHLARSANQAINQFVFDLVQNYGGSPTPTLNGGTIYDGSALYHTNHGNNAVNAPLSYDSAVAAREIMMNQTEPGVTDRKLGLMPRFLVVPVELWNTALIIRNSEAVPGVPLQADVNTLRGEFEVVLNTFSRGDAVRSYFVASPDQAETIEVGFLNGQEAPRVEVQDSLQSDSVFTNGAISYRVIFDFGGAVNDFRSFVGIGFAPAV